MLHGGLQYYQTKKGKDPRKQNPPSQFRTPSLPVHHRQAGEQAVAALAAPLPLSRLTDLRKRQRAAAEASGSAPVSEAGQIPQSFPLQDLPSPKRKEFGHSHCQQIIQGWLVGQSCGQSLLPAVLSACVLVVQCVSQIDNRKS